MHLPASPSADDTARALVLMFRSAYHAGGSPAGAMVYHLKTETGDHVFYLCPDASRLCAEVLMACPAVPLDAPLSLEHFTVVMP